jgi:hypothetical protein
MRLSTKPRLLLAFEPVKMALGLAPSKRRE